MNIVNVGYASTNYYVLTDARPRLLVDVGWPGTLRQLQRNCKQAGIAWADLPYLLITHYHPDHAGLAQEVKRAGVRLIVVETQVGAIPGLRAYIKPAQGYVEIDLTDNIVLSIADSRTFLAGIGIRGEILSTPGHSDDSVTLVLDEGAAFTGDLGPDWGAEDDSATLTRQSWARIRACGATTIYPGHGPARPLK